MNIFFVEKLYVQIEYFIATLFSSCLKFNRKYVTNLEIRIRKFGITYDVDLLEK